MVYEDIKRFPSMADGGRKADPLYRRFLYVAYHDYPRTYCLCFRHL